MQVVNFEKTIFLVGAGISISPPSGIPPAWPIIRLFCQWIAGGDEHLATVLLDRCAPRHHHNPFDFIRFESLIGAIDRIDPQAVSLLQLLESHGVPNSFHMFLAAAAMAGARIITTNFDTRIETAAEWQDAMLNAFVLSTRNRVPKDETRLIKIHGSFPFNGRRHAPPRATLNRIGAIGLGFSNFNGFRKWFSETSRGATVYVMGYSASDSFDVVPLLEKYCNAQRIEWFDYHENTKRLSAQAIKIGDSLPFPSSPHSDFVGMSLSRIKGLHPSTEVLRVKGARLNRYLAHRFGSVYRKEEAVLTTSILPFQDEIGDPIAKNLSELEYALSANPLTSDHRNVLLQMLLSDGMFGEAMTRSEDEHVPELPVTIQPLQSDNVTSDEIGALQAKFAEALDAGEIEQAFGHAEDWFKLEGNGHDPELYLMLAESEFSAAETNGDLQGMTRARRKTRKLSMRSGVLWGLVLAKKMEAMETYLSFQKGHQGVRSNPKLRNQAKSQALSFCYYAFRTGRSDWFVPAVWITGALQETLLLSSEALELHGRLLRWLPEEDAENRGVTLSNLVSIALTMKNRSLANNYFNVLRKIDAARWPMQEVFTLIADAELKRTASRPKPALRRLEQAEILIMEKFSEDTWSQLEKIRAMRAAIIKIWSSERLGAN